MDMSIHQLFGQLIEFTLGNSYSKVQFCISSGWSVKLYIIAKVAELLHIVNWFLCETADCVWVWYFHDAG